MKPIIPIILILGLAGALFFVHDNHDKKINKILVRDSLREAEINRKIYKLDSTATALSYKDSVRFSNFIKLKSRYEKTKKDFDIVRDSLGVLPDL